MITELLCVATGAAIIAVAVRLHVRYERAGEMAWTSARWRDLACDRSGKSAALAAVRLGLSAYAAMTICIMASRPVKTAAGRPALGGAYTFCTFTVWSWTLIAVYLGLAGSASAFHAIGWAPSERVGDGVARFMWAFFEVMFACSILVFLVVWLVLLPEAYIQTHSDSGLLKWTVLSAHNLNLAFMVVDCALNCFHFHRPHFVFIVYYGCAYVVFSWFWFLYDGVFYYFFLDWRIVLTPVSYLGLISVLYGVFLASARLSSRLKPLGNGASAREVHLNSAEGIQGC